MLQHIARAAVWGRASCSGFCFSFPRGSRAVVSLLLLALCLILPGEALAARGVTVTFLPDASGTMTVEEAASPAHADEYRAYAPSFMAFSGLPADFNGAVWLRLAFTPSFEKPAGAVRVSFGGDLPGKTSLSIPHLGEDGKETFTTLTLPASTVFFDLPENEPFPDTLYARFDGAPGLWFRPLVGPAPAKAPPVPMDLVLPGVLAAALLLLLLRYVRSGEEWRLWAALAAGCAIVSAIIPPVPVSGGAYTPAMAAAMAMPGVILLLLTHTARHLFSTPKTMPGYDTFLLCYYAVGVALALAPLVPGQLYLARYLPLWGILVLPLLPTATIALSRDLRGAFLFLCSGLAVILGVAVAAWELTLPDQAHLGGSGALWGLAVGTLLMTGAGHGKPDAKTDQEDVFDSLDRTMGDAAADTALEAFAEKAAHPGTSPDTATPEHTDHHAAAFSAAEPTLRLSQDDDYETPLSGRFSDAFADDTPPLDQRPAAPSAAAQPQPQPQPLGTPEFAATAEPAVEAPVPAPSETAPVSQADDIAAPSLFPQFDLQESAPAMPTPPQTAPVTPPVTAGVADSATPSGAIQKFTDDALLEETFADDAETPAQPFAAPEQEQARAAVPPGHRKVFDLPLLVKEAHDSVAQLAETRNIGLTWFIAPQTGRLFEGESDILETALQRLLRDMVSSLEQGNVRLNVRRMPDSNDNGHIVFTLVEWDARHASGYRNMEGLAEAWALAERTGGLFSVEHTPRAGSTVIFSSLFTPMDKAEEKETAPSDEPHQTAPAEDAEQTPDSPEPIDTAAPAATPETPTEAAAPAQAAIPVFTDYPDIEMPKDFETPAAPAAPSAMDAEELLDEEGDCPRDPARIIVAADTTSRRAAMAEALSVPPYTVLEASSPSASVVLYRRNPSALLVMDGGMPEVDIAEAIQHIHALDAQRGFTPALFLTLVEHEPQAKRLRRAGCLRTLLKPVQNETLLETVTELVPAEFVAPLAESVAHVAAPVAVPVEDTPMTTVPPVPAQAAATPEVSTAVIDIPEEAIAEVPSVTPAPEPERSPAPQAQAPSVTPEAAAEEEPVLELVHEAAKPQPAPEKTKQQVETPTVKTAETTASGQADNATAKVAGKAAAKVEVKTADKPKQEAPAQAPAPQKAPEKAPVKPSVTNAVKASATPPASAAVAQTVTPEAMTAARIASMDPASAAKALAGSGSSLLDMIVTDEEPEAAPAVKATPAAPEAASKKRVLKTATTKPQRPQAHMTAAPKAPEETPPAQNVSVPLPGEEDSVLTDMLPLIPGLIYDLSDAMKDASQGREQKNPMAVQEAAERVAGKAEAFGLSKLERMARCVQRAAAADDIEPMECVLADLEEWVSRYKKSLRDLHRNLKWK